MAVERARRWPPRQRIHLTPEGEAARTAYQTLVRDARGGGGKPQELEAKLTEWAGKLGIRSSDGVLLEELGEGRSPSVNELARAVETCGLRGPDVKAGVDRLYGAALVQPPQVEAPPPPPPSPWRY